MSTTSIWQACPMCRGAQFEIALPCRVCRGSGIVSIITGLPPEWAGKSTITSSNTGKDYIPFNKDQQK